MNNKTPSSALDEFSDIVGLVYETAYSPEKWPHLIEALELYTQSPGTDELLHGRLLSPHFKQAIKIDRKISGLQSKNRVFNQVFNHLPLGLVITNSQANIVGSNHRADRLMASSIALQCTNNMLMCDNERDSQELHWRIQQTIDGTLPKEKSFLMLAPNDPKARISIWLAATDIQNHSNHGHERGAALYISSPSIKPEYDLKIIQKEFSLSSAEARLVKQLTNGCHNLKAAAETLGVSENTVRSQIKTVFNKTGTTGQVELIKKVLTNPSVLFGVQLNDDSMILRDESLTLKNGHAVTLKDGRKLGYSIHGNDDGLPLIYCHALVHNDNRFLPQSDLEKHCSFQIISPRRPGFMGSSWAGVNHTPKDHADDIIELADYLGIKRFHVLGYSNGTVFAAALAYHYPKRISGLTLVSTMVPPDMDRLDLLATTDKLMLRLGQWLPASALTRIAHIVLKSMKERPHELVEKNTSRVSPAEIEILKSPELLTYIQTFSNESYPERSAGVAYDIMTRTRTWGFSLKELRVPTQLWHAKDDSTVNFVCAENMAKSLSNCRTFWQESGGHYLFFRDFIKIMKEIPIPSPSDC